MKTKHHKAITAPNGTKFIRVKSEFDTKPHLMKALTKAVKDNKIKYVLTQNDLIERQKHHQLTAKLKQLINN